MHQETPTTHPCRVAIEAVKRFEDRASLQRLESEDGSVIQFQTA